MRIQQVHIRMASVRLINYINHKQHFTFFLFTPGLRSSLSRDWKVVTVVMMVPSGMTVRSTSTFLVGVIEERIGKALWALRGSSASTYSNWRSQQEKKKWNFQSVAILVKSNDL